MKYTIPEISWHNRDPVLSVDFQPKVSSDEPTRLATGGTDSHVLIWYLSLSETNTVNLEVAADLARHQKAVNVVRWSPNGNYLASGDDESIIFLWKQRTDKDPPAIFDQNEEQSRETWIIMKTLRGHMEDILDIAWSPTSEQLISGSVDNKVLCWDVEKGRYNSILADHKGFVQGVAWDPKNQLLASVSSDRVFRTFDASTKKVLSRSSKAVLPFPEGHQLHGMNTRLYYDDTLQTYFRRLHFSPDGMLIAVPSGHIEAEQNIMKPINAVYIYTRYSLKVPACILPCGDSPALVVRWSPIIFKLRADGPKAAFPLSDKRMLLAVATKCSVILYDTQQKTPIALVSNIHYTRLTDLTWTKDGRILVASSTDGFCSVIMFSEGELGEILPEELPKDEPMDTTEAINPEPEKENQTKSETQKNTINKIAVRRFKTPQQTNSEKSVTKKPEKSIPVAIEAIDETAMVSWSDNSNLEAKTKPKIDATIVIEDSEDMKLVYDETQSIINKSCDKESPKTTISSNSVKISPQSIDTPSKIGPFTPKSVKKSAKTDESAPSTPKAAKLSDKNSPKTGKIEEAFASKAVVKDSQACPVVIASPKAPRRVNFVTLSSPKNSKKK